MWRDHPFALLTELAVFLAFAVSLYVMANLETIVSMWAMVPHVLCNLVVVLLFVRHRVMGRPAMYWNHFDAVVVLLFLYFLANIYYSEIRAISWQTAALYFDSLPAYLMGRMLFYHRVRAFAAVLIVTLVVAWMGIYANTYKANKAAEGYRAQAAEMKRDAKLSPMADGMSAAADEVQRKAEYQESVAERYKPLSDAYLLLICFWAISAVFLWLEKPSSLAFLVYGAGVIGLFVFYSLGRLAWALGADDHVQEVVTRNAKFESLRTAVSIFKSYPITGSGLGTFPALFDAYRLTPAAPYGTGFNAYVFAAVETGIVGVLLLLYFLIRLPLHAARRWKMMPNNRLRFAVFVHLLFIVLLIVQSFYGSNLFNPAVWFPVWAILGTAVSLIVVRDPIRIFESLVPAGRANDPEAIHRKVVYASRGGVFGRTPLAKLPRPRISILRRLGVIQSLMIITLTAIFLVFTGAELAPYAARQLATPEGVDNPELSEEAHKAALASDAYGTRVEQALRVFPLDSNNWSARANHFEAKISDPLAIYNYSDRIEVAYEKALEHNPYRPEVYEKLYFLYRDINRQGDALDIIKRGVQTNPNQLILRLLLVRELERMGDYQLATWHVKQALLRIAPDETELYLRLAELYEIQGMTNDAKQYYLYAKQVVPETPQTKERLDRLKQRLGL